MGDKNMADVADKAVDKLSQVADAIGRMAPGIWESAVRSERVEGIVNCALLAGSCVLALFVARQFFRELKKFSDSDGRIECAPSVVWGLTAGVAVLIAGLMTLCSLGTEVSRATSPEYYAAHALLQAAK